MTTGTNQSSDINLLLAKFIVKRAICISVSTDETVRVGIVAKLGTVEESMGIFCDALRAFGGIHHEGLWTGSIYGRRWSIETYLAPV